MDDESRQEINEIVDDIESGEITEHFTTETLQQERKKRRTNLRELKIRRWAADQDVNGNRVVEAFDLFLPGHTLIDNPNLADLVREIEKEENIDFLVPPSLKRPNEIFQFIIIRKKDRIRWLYHKNNKRRCGRC